VQLVEPAGETFLDAWNLLRLEDGAQ